MVILTVDEGVVLGGEVVTQVVAAVTVVVGDNMGAADLRISVHEQFQTEYQAAEKIYRYKLYLIHKLS